MTAPNFTTLQRQQAVHHTLITHQELPALLTWDYDAATDTVLLRVDDVAAVDAYGEVFKVNGPEPEQRWFLHVNGVYAYRRYNTRLTISAYGVDRPVEAAEQSAAVTA